MVNFNGKILELQEASLSIHNRGFNYGDAVFETLKIVNGTILYWEDHYFRLMASMRILRMEIPMTFTLEFLENEIHKVIKSNYFQSSSVRVKLIVNRIEGGLYLPESNDVSFLISVSELKNVHYLISDEDYTIELFKDYYITPHLLSTLKTNNRIINVVGSIFANENAYDNCLLLNSNKSVVEALNGNVFLVNKSKIKTPPIEDGCLKGIMRKQIIEIIQKDADLEIEESSISPFELQKADELFITNTIMGIQPVTQYRKKRFSNTISRELIDRLNMKLDS